MDVTAALAATQYAAGKPATRPTAESAATQAVASFAETLAQSEHTAKQAMTGEADPHSLVKAMGDAKFAVDAAVSVRDRVVEAYQEILRMPV